MTSGTEESAGEETSHSSIDVEALLARALNGAATIATSLGSIFAGFLVVHIVLTVSQANPTNAITVMFRDAAANLTLGVGDLFVPQSPELRIVLNLGVAAILWLVVGFVLAAVFAAFASRMSDRSRAERD